MKGAIKRCTTVVIRSEAGFTLIEMLVVIVIIGMIAGFIGPNIWKKFAKAQKGAAKAQIEQLAAAIGTFRLDVGRFPSTEEGLDALLKNPGSIDKWDGPYLQKEKVPLDPWNRPFEYKCPGDHGDFDIVSLGADGQPGGDGDDADIVSWE